MVSVACHDGRGWQRRLSNAATAAAGDTGYAPAASLKALEACLTATNAGTPLSVDKEAAALSALP